MLHGKKIAVVIPTLNEAPGIKATLEAIPPCVDEVLVIDGNSNDGTGGIATQCGARVIVEERKGYGLAFLVGFENATGDIIAAVDGDGTYPIELLPNVVEHMDAKRLDFVSCNRFPLEDEASMRRRNLVGNYALSAAASTLWAHRFKDILSGMWVFRRSCLDEMRLFSHTWNFSEEIKIEAYRKLGKRFGEYKIPYRERLGETKLPAWKVGLLNLSYLTALRLNIQSKLNHF
jgi:glycosyltransferase involved in cell wall biosynthesis